MTGPSPKARRVLLLIPNLGQGGAEMQLYHLARGLAEGGDDVTIACLQRAHVALGPLEDAGVRVVALEAMSRPAKAARLPRLYRLARQADIVHCGLFDASFYGRLAAVAARRPVTVTEHSSDRSMQVSARGRSRARLIGWHHRLLSPVTATTIACAASQIDLLRREGVAAARLALVPNGVPVGDIRAAGARGAVTRADLGVSPEARLVVQVGRLTPEKSQRTTVDAVAELRERLGDVQAVFVGAGDDRSGPARAQELGATWARFLGGRSDVAALLALADLAVLPSRVDAFPMAALEAMALGVPQVTTDVGDLAAVVDGSGSGLSVPAGDHAAFVAACERVLTDDALRERLGRQAAEAAWRYDVGPMVERYSAIFEAARRGEPVPAESRP